MKVRERRLAMKLVRVEQSSSTVPGCCSISPRRGGSTSVTSSATWRDSFAVGSKCARSAPATRTSCWADTALAGAPLLHDVAARVPADLDQDGQAEKLEPEPFPAVGPMRPVEVLFAV